MQVHNNTWIYSWLLSRRCSFSSPSRSHIVHVYICRHNCYYLLLLIIIIIGYNCVSMCLYVATRRNRLFIYLFVYFSFGILHTGQHRAHDTIIDRCLIVFFCLCSSSAYHIFPFPFDHICRMHCTFIVSLIRRVFLLQTEWLAACFFQITKRTWDTFSLLPPPVVATDLVKLKFIFWFAHSCRSKYRSESDLKKPWHTFNANNSWNISGSFISGLVHEYVAADREFSKVGLMTAAARQWEMSDRTVCGEVVYLNDVYDFCIKISDDRLDLST